MTLRNIANELINRGHSVLFRERVGGGIEIISIDGQKYRARKGNEVARKMLNQKLSPLMQSHLTTIKRPKGQARVKLPSININIMKELRKLQRIQRKLGIKERTTIKNIRGHLEHHTEEETITMLQETQRTYKKEVWTGLYGKFVAQLNQDNMEWNNKKVSELIDFLIEADANDYIINDALFEEFINEVYNLEQLEKAPALQISAFAENYLERLKANARERKTEND